MATITTFVTKTPAVLAFVFTAALAFAQTAGAPAAKTHVWKVVTGDEVVAEFLGMKDGRVQLKAEQGMLSPALANLAPESRALAEKLAAEAEKKVLDDARGSKVEGAMAGKITPAEKASKIDPLNYINTGDRVYGPVVTKEYDAYIIEPNCKLFVFIKEDGEHKSEPVRIQHEVHYANTSFTPTRHMTRNVTKVDGAPVFNEKDGTLRVKRLHDDDVRSEIWITCKPGFVTLGYKVDDPPGISFPSRHRFNINMFKAFASVQPDEGGAFAYFNPRMSPEGGNHAQLVELAKGWKVDFRTSARNAQPQTYLYTDTAQSLPPRIASATVSGGVYGRNTVTISTTGAAGNIWPYIYKSTRPLDGWSMQFNKEPGNSAPDFAAGMLRVEVK